MRLLLFLSSLIIGTILISSGKTFDHSYAVYTDRHGTWRVPTNGLPTQLTNKMINNFPTLNMKLKAVDIEFDLDNDKYFDTCKIWILIFGLCGAVYFFFTIVFFIMRYAFNCFGGREIPRTGYKQSHVNCLRFFIILFSFIIEFFLIYGYFSNSDIHESLTILVNSFLKIGTQLQEQAETIISNLPDDIANTFYNKTLFQEDLNFSARAANKRTTSSHDLLKNYEKMRMSILLINLILATIAIAFGITAGAINKGFWMILMIILFSISGFLMFISFGAHFAASLIVSDYCNEISDYINSNGSFYNSFIPMRLQYFIPCISSPLYPFLYDHFVVNALTSIAEFSALDNIEEKFHPQWFNITEDYLANYVNSSNDPNVKNSYEIACNKSELLSIVDQSSTCMWSKKEMKEDNFLMCTYTRTNLDMLMVTQGLCAIFIVILTILGFPAVKRFEWAGNLGASGILDGRRNEFRGKPAKARRSV